MLNTTIVIDDSEADRYLARRTLKKAGVTHRVLEFPDALSALGLLGDREAFAQQCGPWPPRAVVLLDINMPRMDGFEFLEALDERIKAGDVLPGALAVVMYSTSDFQSDVDRARSHGIVVDYVVKPITVEFAARIARIAESLDAVP
ncbi:MAG: response regulator [Bryobacterales bacterium]